MQFFQEFLIKQGVIFTKTGLILGFDWEFRGAWGQCVPGSEMLLRLKNGGWERFFWSGAGFLVLMDS
ncbi:MAG: hypothetical protein WCH85_10095 [Methanomicrobiales archaeon]